MLAAQASLVVRCVGSDECGANQYCKFDNGTCGEMEDYGTCTTVDPDTACPLIHDPVCGCDGHSYLNACWATLALVSIRHAGDCP